MEKTLGTEIADAAQVRKLQLRCHFKAVRQAMALADRALADQRVAQKVACLLAWKSASIVLSYISVGEEVDTHALVRLAWRSGKTVAAPRVVTHTRRLQWYRIQDFNHLETQAFGIKQPLMSEKNRIDALSAHAASLALVPALAFDELGYRLGYGGGFYDVFLADFPGISIGLGRQAQMVDDFSACGVRQACDVPVDLVVTEEGLL